MILPTTNEREAHSSQPSRSRFLPLTAVLALFASLAVGPPGALADTETQLEVAKRKLTQINANIDAQLAQLARLRDEANILAQQTNAAEVALEEAAARLEETESRIAEAVNRYDALRRQLDDRAVEMFMGGSGSNLGFILGSSSMADLADRLEFTSAITRADAGLASAVENLRVHLTWQRDDQAAAVQERATAASALQDRLGSLQDRFAEEQKIYSSIINQRAAAESIVASLSKRYQQELASQVPPPLGGTAPGTGAGSAPAGPNPFSYCPVGTPRALTDSFGAPRYGGGYHLHAGNDIMAPEGIPIFATFNGTARDASSSLGGLAVVVAGSSGWTYNAHMVRIGELGSVLAGDVIGYVGATGDTATPHNHFEWHPNVVPSSWPASAYGYSVVGDAVNPYPLLAQVC